MDLKIYAVEAEVEAQHWWFIGRRKLFSVMLKSLDLKADCKILDVGTSTGTNIRMLEDLKFDDVVGLDLSESAIEYCASKGFNNVQQGDVLDIPFEDESFDLVLATDIIEHVDDDEKAMSELKRILRPGGILLITVPAFMLLWGKNDEEGHHKRRYLAREVKSLASIMKLDILTGFYFNFILFLPILMVRFLLKRIKNSSKSENEINSPLINSILTFVFKIDVFLSRFIHPPFGVSYLMLCKKPID